MGSHPDQTFRCAVRLVFGEHVTLEERKSRSLAFQLSTMYYDPSIRKIFEVIWEVSLYVLCINPDTQSTQKSVQVIGPLSSDAASSGRVNIKTV